MPIDKAWASLYPSNWREISATVREAAGQQCEWCGVRNHTTITRHNDEDRWTDEDNFELLDQAIWRNSRGEQIDTPEIHAATWLYHEDWNVRAVDIVLTVAHLDQDPRNCERENLRALCQKCHITHDKKPEQRRTRERLRAEVLEGQQTIFG